MTKHTNTKRALFTSIISMLLCVSMLIGSTFAWFTDNATTKVNTIKSGTLDIQLLDEDGNNLEGETLMFVNANGETDVLFEPGATFNTQKFKIHQNGNLEFKYEIEITGLDGDAELLKVIEFKLKDEKGIEITSEGHSTDFVGTYKVTFDPETGKNIATMIAGLDSNLMYVEAHMKEEAGNEYQGKTLNGISITVRATQDTVEFDSTTDQYDANAAYDAKPWEDNASAGETDIKVSETDAAVIEIYTAAGLAQFAKNVNVNNNNYAGKTVKLMNDIDLQNGLWTPIGQTGATEFKGVFDGNGKTIYNLYVDNKDESASCSSGLFGWIESHGSEGVTVKNLTIDGANVSGHHYVGVIAGYVYGTIENCHVMNADVSCTSVNDDANGDKCGLIAGYVGEDAIIKDCTGADSKIEAGRDAGQIVGAAKAACVENCSAANVNVTANGSSTGANIRNEIIGRVL